MTHERFNNLVEETLTKTKKVLTKKQAEYNLDEDRLSSFKRAGMAAGRTPEQTLYGYMLKHWMSVTDMINSGQPFKKEVWDEKVGDLINYLLLLRGLLEDDNMYTEELVVESPKRRTVLLEETKQVKTRRETKN